MINNLWNSPAFLQTLAYTISMISTFHILVCNISHFSKFIDIILSIPNLYLTFTTVLHQHIRFLLLSYIFILEIPPNYCISPFYGSHGGRGYQNLSDPPMSLNKRLSLSLSLSSLSLGNCTSAEGWVIIQTQAIVLKVDSKRNNTVAGLKEM